MKYKILTYFLLFLIVIGGISWIFDRAGLKRISEMNLKVQQDSVKYYTTKLGQEVASKRAYVVQNRKFKFLNDSLKDVVREFKKAQSVTTVKTVTVIDSIPIPYQVPVPIKFNREFSVGDEHFKIEGVSNSLGLKLNKVELYNTQNVVFGQKRGGWIHADIINSNPYIQTTDIQVYTYKVKKKWYEKWYITGPIGIGIGMAIK